MRKSLRTAAVAIAALLLAVPSAAAQGQYPEEPGNGIADLVNVLDAADEDSILRMLNRMRTQAGVEVRVLTVQSVDGFRTGARTPEEFATGVYNAWRLGYGQRQDGVLVLLSVDDRFTRIELGDNVPADKDAQMRAVVDGTMVPRFRDGDMSGGVREGVLEIARAFGAATVAPAPPLTPEAPYDPLAERSPGSRPVPAYDPPARPVNGPYDIPLNTSVMPIVLLLTVILGIFGLALLATGMKRKCAHCRMPLQRVDESSEDVYLDSGRRLEEVLGSVNYTVWQCPGCGTHEIQRSARWFSGKSACPECSYKTVSVDRETVEWPTYDHGGMQRVEKDCAHCHWHDVDMVHLPRKERPAPSSSSSGGGGWSSASSSGSSRSSGGGSSGRSSGGSSSGRGSSGRW